MSLRLAALSLLQMVAVSTASASDYIDSVLSGDDYNNAHACGDLFRNISAQNGGNGVATAIDVYKCYITVPVYAPVASQLIKYWNDTLQFQSTLEYLKNPPSGYQQPAVDLIAGLNEIQATLDRQGYANEYQFEAALQNVLYSANDAHVQFSGGLLSAFSFGSSWDLVSVSVDGLQPPKVYFFDDVQLDLTSPSPDWTPSAITHIDGVDVVEYLTRFAALNSRGTLEPNADWNTVFESPVLDVLGQTSTWGGSATFYPGDQFSYTFEDGSTLDDQWLAVYNVQGGAPGPLETGGDMYNYFVTGLLPAACNADVVPDSCNDTLFLEASEPVNPPTSLHNISSAYPDDPIVASDSLTFDGWLTGYLLEGESLAVLSIPSFAADSSAIDDFTDKTQEFITQAKSANISKLVIDLQSNQGGDALLAYTTFKQFFPSQEPFAGSERRAHPLANFMGSMITPYWESSQQEDPDGYYVNSADEWIATIRIDARTGANFSSWAALYGPESDGVQNFTVTEQLNITNSAFDLSALGLDNETDIPTVLSNPRAGEPPFAANDIVILSDALCSSTCALFLEMMRTDAGVRNVVIGGRPSYGPMQTPSRSRGSRYYGLDELSLDLENAENIWSANNSDNPPPVDLPNRDLDFYYLYGGIDLRAQVRKNESVPLSMQYEAADCRIFWTPDTITNFTNLWKYAADAIWRSPQLCVEGSTGYASTNNGSHQAPPTSKTLSAVAYDHNGIPAMHFSGAGIPFLYLDEPMPDAGSSEFGDLTDSQLLSYQRDFALSKSQIAQLIRDLPNLSDTDKRSLAADRRLSKVDVRYLIDPTKLTPGEQSQVDQPIKNLRQASTTVRKRSQGRGKGDPFHANSNGHPGRGSRKRRARKVKRASRR